MTEFYLEAGMIGIVGVLFSYMIMNIIKSLKVQNEDIDELRQSIHKMEATIDNMQGIIIKLITRTNDKDKAEAIRSDRTNEARSKSLERFGTRLERLERTTLRLEGRILNGYKGD